MKRIIRILFNVVITTAIAVAGFYGRFDLLILLAFVHSIFNERGEK